MQIAKLTRLAGRYAGAGLGIAAAAYGSYVAYTWLHYGSPHTGDAEGADLLLDRFMPDYEAGERHHITIAAPAQITYSAACDMQIQNSALTRAIFKARELILGGKPDERQYPPGLLEMVKSIGWGVLAEVPGREIVIGAVTKPWEANVVFRAIKPEEFASFGEPDYVKIIWSLRADPVSAGSSIFRTETRSTTTDAQSRAKFRVYWSFFSPGIWMIRRLSLGPLRTAAEARARETQIGTHEITDLRPSLVPSGISDGPDHSHQG